MRPHDPPPTRLARWLRRRSAEAAELLRLALYLAALLAVVLAMLAMVGLIAPPSFRPLWLAL
jgi:hypothetical protein